jgi:putative ubiquitin-RnfH superfamily antitoxin RatB of RatAB toxin-antitoxin module
MTENAATKTIHVEVVLAMPERQELLGLDIASGSSVADAIEQSALIDRFDGVELDLSMVGIFGRKVSAGQVLRDGDRVEIYRPLIADPKEKRRQRAIKQAEIDSK